MKKKLIRLTLYLLGLFLLALGIGFSIKSQLGVSPVTSIPQVFSRITAMTIGRVTMIYYSLCVVMQIIILRSNYKLKSLLQIGFSYVFGYFTDFVMSLLSGLLASTYISQLGLLMASLLIISLGLFLIIISDIVVNAPEGLCLAISEKWGFEFSKVKIAFDMTSVTIAIVISIAFFGNIGAIREGTIIAAISIGKLVGLLMDKYGEKVNAYIKS